MKRNILVMAMVALMSIWVPAYVCAEDGGTHGADFTGEDWGGDIDLGFDFDDDEHSQTGVREVSVASSSLRVEVENGEIAVWSADHRLIPIHRMNGTVAATISLRPGKNLVKAPGEGLFIVAGKKILL